MVLGAIVCPANRAREIAVRLREIRAKHKIRPDVEIKWTKVSPSKIDFYLDVIDYFFDDDDLSFRAVVAPKAGLDHERFAQTHDDWYYKMMFYLVRNVLPAQDEAFIYLDKKDTNGQEKIERLRNVIANAEYDFGRSKIRRLQIVESNQVGPLQLADLLIGAVNYANRGDSSSVAKLRLIERIRGRSGVSLTHTTLLSETKMNIFRWRAQ
jgi:enterobacteria phage P1